MGYFLGLHSSAPRPQSFHLWPQSPEKATKRLPTNICYDFCGRRAVPVRRSWPTAPNHHPSFVKINHNKYCRARGGPRPPCNWLHPSYPWVPPPPPPLKVDPWPCMAKRLGSVAGPVFQATGKSTFENGQVGWLRFRL
jgi:hypothetical protein